MLNHIIIMGRLTKNPELRSTGNGTKVASFRVACDRDYKSGEEKQADFIDCVAWRQRGEFVCRNFVKGMPITVEGRLQIREYKDNDGITRRVAEINVDNTYFCGGDRKTSSAPAQQSAFEDIDNSDGELPWKMDDDEELPL